jgi:hypothetical protein
LGELGADQLRYSAVEQVHQPGFELQHYDFAMHGIHPLAILERASFWLSASATGSSVWVWYSELTDRQANQVFKASLF